MALVVRTRRPFFRRRPGSVLLTSTLALVVVAFASPYLPLVGVLGSVPLPAEFVAAVASITYLSVSPPRP